MKRFYDLPPIGLLSNLEPFSLESLHAPEVLLEIIGSNNEKKKTNTKGKTILQTKMVIVCLKRIYDRKK